jgi:hypothetical protein
MLLHKNTRILNLHLNLVAARIKTLAAVGNKIWNAYVKEVFYLWAQACIDTLHQLIIIAEVLWSQPVLQVGEQEEVACS